MNTDFTLDPFSLSGAAVYISPEGATTVLLGKELKPRLQRLPAGLLLAAFELRSDADAHPQLWEMHPAGDELLVMLSGALHVETADGARRSRSTLTAGRSVVVPRGAWHRLELQAPGLLLTLTPLQGTRHSGAPEEQP